MIMSYLEKIKIMSELSTELNQKIMIGKQAFKENNLDLAMKSFSKASAIANNAQPPLKSIVGISQAYLALIETSKGVKDDILEKVYAAIDYFPESPSNPLAYVSILTDIGLGFQRNSLFECSIIVLKKALDLTKNKSLKDNLETTSVVSRILAYSYHKVGNSSSAAKLFRIAADLTDKPTLAIDLYRNAAYLYYRVERKEDALNILQTAYDKTGIIEDFTTQNRIADFQGTIAYEIFNHYYQRDYIDMAMEYLDLAQEKFESIKDEFWIIKLLYEKAMVYERLDKIWQRNKTLNIITGFDLNKENEEYIIKAILLLTVHELEGDHYSQAEYYLKQIPSTKYMQLNQILRQKIDDLKVLLEKSRERTQIYSNIKLSRGDLELPADQLVSEEQTLTENQIQAKTILNTEVSNLLAGTELEARFKRETNIPLQKLVSEIKSSSSRVDPSSESTTELASIESSVSQETLAAELKAPSVDVLQDLFDSSKGISEPETKMDSRIGTIQSEPVDENAQESVSISPIVPITVKTQDNTSALERLFTAHQQNPEQETPISSDYESINNEIETLSDTPLQVSSTPPSSQEIINDPSTISKQLQKAGWTVQINFASSTRRGSEPDIIAEKGLIRKNRKLIFFAENPIDAEICSFLLQTNPESGEKVIFLLRGDPQDVTISYGIKLVTRINQLF